MGAVRIRAHGLQISRTLRRRKNGTPFRNGVTSVFRLRHRERERERERETEKERRDDEVNRLFCLKNEWYMTSN
jgi:hypothetical protein